MKKSSNKDSDVCSKRALAILQEWLVLAQKTIRKKLAVLSL
ncbi:MAG: hypothetical protein WCH34_09230 [Bacteroidota bacterium]